jgi:5-methylcytosine-specific restriction endonuclease McrBC GTP-binding regulatory subunit McrB
MNLFCNYLKVGNYVVVSYGNFYVRAIGKVTGEYEFKEESPFPNSSDYKHFRGVDWIFHDSKIAAKEIYNKNLSQQSIYKLEKKEIKQDFFIKEKKVDAFKLPKNPKNFVLVIDEINRGNVSSIFGELITLIEKDKRAGTEEELSVTLPYSKKEFKVPQNVYLIGTMNTADRRRFSFREMPPKPELMLKEGKLKDNQGKIGDVDVVRILETINHRIEKLIDKDHKIGHSYFLGISDEDDLKVVFKNKVIPLLEEYFFGDFGKISLVLGSSFITKTTKANVVFAKNNEYDQSIAADLLERSVYEITDSIRWDFKAIYE